MLWRCCFSLMTMTMTTPMPMPMRFERLSVQGTWFEAEHLKVSHRVRTAILGTRQKGVSKFFCLRQHGGCAVLGIVTTELQTVSDKHAANCI